MPEKSEAAKTISSFSKLANKSQLFFSPVKVQPKLTVGSVDDPCEREADAMADKIVQLPVQQNSIARLNETKTSFFSPKLISPPVLQPERTSNDKEKPQRKEEKKEEEKKFVFRKEKSFDGGLNNIENSANQKTGEDELNKQLQRKSQGNGSAEMEAPSIVNDAISKAGQPLDPESRNFFEPRFGTDFSDVKIHTGSTATESSRSINAHAYTIGKNIVFNEGKFDSGTEEGKRLLAHELTHVVQQNDSSAHRTIRRKVVDEPQKYPHEIDYNNARQANLDSWYSIYKFFDLFQEEGVFPGSTPNAYANKVYELQVKLAEIAGSAWTGIENGVLEEKLDNLVTLNLLRKSAKLYSLDNSKKNGFNEKKLERLSRYESAFDSKVSPLQSTLFKDNLQLNLVNRNPYFSIHFDDYGDYVKLLQIALLNLKYDLGNDYKPIKKGTEKEVTRKYGEATKKAVENFQKDSGFEGKQIDGIVGQTTLQLLDKRMGTAYYSGITGGSYSFNIPVTSDMVTDDPKKTEEIKMQLLKQLLMIAFPVNEGQVNAMLDSGWHWFSYKPITLMEVARGYRQATINRSEFEAIMGSFDDNSNTKSEDTTSEKLEQQSVNLESTGALYDLLKQREQVKSEITLAEMASSSQDMIMIPEDPRLPELRSKLHTLEIQRDEQLNRLHLTEGDYVKQKTAYIENFEKFAAQVAYRMLSENEIFANIEYEHYKKRENIKKLKDEINQLKSIFDESDKCFIQGVSLATTGDPNHYKSEHQYLMENAVEKAKGGYSTAMARRQLDTYRQSSLEKKSDTNSYFAAYYDSETKAAQSLQ